MNRLLLDNSHLHLINMARESNIVFDRIVKKHAFSFHSTRHLDDQISRSNQSSLRFNFFLSHKYKTAFFAPYFNAILLDVYSFVYPGYSEQLRRNDFILSRSYRKMFSVTVQDSFLLASVCWQEVFSTYVLIHSPLQQPYFLIPVYMLQKLITFLYILLKVMICASPIHLL